MAYVDTDYIFDNLRRYKRCILPDSFPGINFDDEGVCNYCHDQPPFKGRSTGLREVPL